MAEIEVKAGDVWESAVYPTRNIFKVAGARVVYWYRDTDGLLCGGSSDAGEYENFTLTERDGRPYRHFKAGAWYPCRIGQDRYILEYLGGDLFRQYTNGHREHMTVMQFDCIGEAVTVGWVE